MASNSRFQSISEDDIQELLTSKNSKSTEKTIKTSIKQFFFLCCCGRENTREITRETFKIGKDASGREYVYQGMGEGDKNHTATDKPDDTVGEGK